MELSGKTINFLGDSITQGHGTTGPEKVFHQLIKAKYNMKHAYNYGLGGTRIARNLVPSEAYPHHDLTFELRAEIMERNAEAVVVFGGTNDFGQWRTGIPCRAPFLPCCPPCEPASCST